MLVSDYILKFLQKKRVKTVFLMTGGAISFVVDAFSRNKKINYISIAHEQAAAMMADSYSRLGPNFAATMVTSGPGATNLITGIACSWFDSIPNIHISGQVNTNEIAGAVKSTKKVRQVGFQETDIVSIVKPITKFAYQIKKAEEIRYILEKAYYLSTTGRPGPVLVDVPMDIQRKKININKLKSFSPVNKSQNNKFIILKKKLKILQKAFETSSKPIIIIGGAVRISKSNLLLNKFLKNNNIPFVTTWSGFDCCDFNSKNYVGTLGVYGSRAANFAVQNSDLILNLGSRLDTRITGGKPETFARNAKIISVDIDLNELNKKRGLNNFLKFNLNLKLFLKELIKIELNLNYDNANKWSKLCYYWKHKYPNVLNNYKKQEFFVNPYFFMDQLSKFLNKKDVVIADDGAHLTWAMQGFKLKYGQRFFSAFGNSPMGYALPASIGASIALNKKRIICIDGDGSIQINIQELHTLKKLNLPLKIFIMNNNGYGIIKQFQELYLEKRFEASGKGVTNPNFKRISKAFGLEYEIIKNNSQINRKIKKVLKSKLPFIIEVMIKPSQKIVPKLEFGRPLEDLSPLLSRKELNKEMLIPVIKKNRISSTEIN